MGYKTGITFLLLLAVLITLAATLRQPLSTVEERQGNTRDPNRSTEDDGAWLDYTNDAHDFQFRYPPTWRLVATGDQAFDLYGPQAIDAAPAIPLVHLTVAENGEQLGLREWAERNKIELEIPQTDAGVAMYEVAPFGMETAIAFNPVLGGGEDIVYLLEHSANIFQLYVYLQEAPAATKAEISALISSFRFVE